MAMDIDKFFKVVNLTTSSVDGEALAAIRKANAMLKSNQTTWEMVILGKPRKAEFTEEKKSKKKSTEDKDRIAEMFEAVLKSVEGYDSEDFIHSIHDFWKTRGFLTPKQKSALEKFYNNCS